MTLQQTFIKPYSTAPADEMDITVPMNEEWQRDGECMTGLDKALQISIRANITGRDTTKI
jgi:hypothetical protein